ncbi:hypothetical protein JM18_001365 [Phytophthora kernoviae]|uniref:RING-type domain-containing protein n=2 Tax=Phytophthora kernoviae TaxID=325452 RepID=A0A8T0M7B9_9STRA|nr:hypothetical protein G195_005097 [Phytophthora kernoviae 00238/432]KAG2529662.1 hypothetical protein JM18_001365 [Phytophthora kernoviae]KAG2531113.1 hypothetical protein JM16_001229 [Phytophthora kernoviae]
MPQSLHPRVDPQASSYWEEDTASSREMARAMEEEEAADRDPEDEGKKKTSLLTVALSEELHSRRHTLSNQVASLLGPDGLALDDVEGLRVEDMGSSPVNAQLSPAGLISIAAADIDEAQGNSSQPPVNGELDLAFIQSLRKATTTDTGSDNQRPTRSTSSSSPSENEQEEADGKSKLRFLSLLRRINELRSQQVNNESWDGLPYPQILSLPTFKYELREKTETDNQTEDTEDGHRNNTMCAVCCDEFEVDEMVRALPCLHFYHRECIDQWLVHHRMCPICKYVVNVY